MTMPQKISDEIDVHTLPALELKAYWVIDKLSNSNKDRFSSSEIANYLIEEIGFRTSRQAIRYALDKNRKTCHKNASGYKLMEEGRTELKKHSGQQGVIFVDANKPFTAKNYTLKKILGDTYNQISLCDPYVDQNTLDVIFNNFKKQIPIKILTVQIIEKSQGMFKRELHDLRKESFNVEVRVYNNSMLHDRYIMSDQHFWLSGNSLNFLGKKESFLVLLGEDIRQSMLATFNSRWNVANPL
jgi:hypothetical protein